MEESQRFGARLRELRTAAGLTLSKLADRCHIDFTYLSKIESGALPPPSGKVIRQLAAALNADKDELLILAGKIPPDIAEMLKSREALEHFRSGRIKKAMGQISPSFGQRLRELRQKLGLTLKELETRVNVNYTYLSKIENGILPPPSEKVVLQLAEALNADREELLLLAGILPPDIIEKLKNPKFLKTLRSRINEQATGKAEKPRYSLPGIPVPNIRAPVVALAFKPIYRVALPIILVIAIALSLWYASPTQALEIAFITPANGTLGGTYTFTTTVNINQNELVPIQSVNLEIYNVADPTKKATLENLPLADSALQPHAIKEGASSGSAMVSASVTGGWTGGYGYGYGYAYWLSQAYSFGYGYGYGYGGGTTSITYTVQWTSPAGWPAGAYKIDAKVTASGPSLTQTFTKSSNNFILNVAGGGGGGGGAPAPTTPEPGTTDVSDFVTSEGVFTQNVTATSADGNVELTIPEGTVGLTSDGQPLSEITIVPTDAPTGASTNNVLGQIYDIGPDGATFVPPITLTFHFDPDDVPDGEVPAIHRWDPDANDGDGAWVEIPGAVVNMEAGTITVEIGDFTVFAILHTAVPTPPTTTPPTTTPPTTTPPTTPPTTTPPTTTPPTTTPPTTTPPTTTPPITTPPTTTPPPEGAVNWGLIGGVIAAAIVIAIITFIMILRYRRI